MTAPVMPSEVFEAASAEQRTEALFERLAAHVRSGNTRLLGVLRAGSPWRVLADVDALNLLRDSTAAEFSPHALAVGAFATWHQGQPQPSLGRPGASIGTVLRHLGKSQTLPDPQVPAAARLLHRMLRTESLEELAPLLLDAIRRHRRLPAAAPPHWATLAIDLTQWESAHGDHVRISWARDFTTDPADREPERIPRFIATPDKATITWSLG